MQPDVLSTTAPLRSAIVRAAHDFDAHVCLQAVLLHSKEPDLLQQLLAPDKSSEPSTQQQQQDTAAPRADLNVTWLSRVLRTNPALIDRVPPHVLAHLVLATTQPAPLRSLTDRFLASLSSASSGDLMHLVQTIVPRLHHSALQTRASARQILDAIVTHISGPSPSANTEEEQQQLQQAGKEGQENQQQHQEQKHRSLANTMCQLLSICAPSTDTGEPASDVHGRDSNVRVIESALLKAALHEDDADVAVAFLHGILLFKVKQKRRMQAAVATATAAAAAAARRDDADSSSKGLPLADVLSQVAVVLHARQVLLLPFLLAAATPDSLCHQAVEAELLDMLCATTTSTAAEANAVSKRDHPLHAMHEEQDGALGATGGSELGLRAVASLCLLLSSLSLDHAIQAAGLRDTRPKQAVATLDRLAAALASKLQSCHGGSLSSAAADIAPLTVHRDALAQTGAVPSVLSHAHMSLWTHISDQELVSNVLAAAPKRVLVECLCHSATIPEDAVLALATACCHRAGDAAAGDAHGREESAAARDSAPPLASWLAQRLTATAVMRYHRSLAAALAVLTKHSSGGAFAPLQNILRMRLKLASAHSPRQEQPSSPHQLAHATHQHQRSAASAAVSTTPGPSAGVGGDLSEDMRTMLSPQGAAPGRERGRIAASARVLSAVNRCRTQHALAHIAASFSSVFHSQQAPNAQLLKRFRALARRIVQRGEQQFDSASSLLPDSFHRVLKTLNTPHAAVPAAAKPVPLTAGVLSEIASGSTARLQSLGDGDGAVDAEQFCLTSLAAATRDTAVAGDAAAAPDGAVNRAVSLVVDAVVALQNAPVCQRRLLHGLIASGARHKAALSPAMQAILRQLYQKGVAGCCGGGGGWFYCIGLFA